MEDEWRVIVGFPDYVVSQYGQVMRVTPDSLGRHAGRVMFQKTYNKFGHLQTRLTATDRSRVFRCIHTLVAEAFIGLRPTPSHEVAHWDGKPANNYFKNLRWATRKENAADRLRHGTDPALERNPRAKLTRDLAEQLLLDLQRGFTRPELCSKYNIGNTTITRVKRGRWARQTDLKVAA